MRASRFVLVLVLVLVLGRLGRGQDRPAAPETPRAAEVKALIERLAAPDFKQREAAKEALLKIGADATPLLEAAAKDPDPERSSSAKEILSLLRWKLPPLLEAAIGKSLDDYPALPVEQRRAGLEKVRQFIQSAKILVPFLANVARFDPEPELRTEGLELYLHLTPEGDAFHDQLVLDAIDAEPPRDVHHFARARLLLRLGKVEEALRAAKKAAELPEPDPRAAIFVADAFLAGGHSKEAIAWLDGLREAAEKDAKKANDVPDILVRLGEAYLLAGEKQKGDEVLAEATKLALADHARGKDLLLRVARAYMRVKRPDDARDAVQKAVGKAPYDPDVNLALAELDLSLGRPSEALKRFLNEAKYYQKDLERLKRVRDGLAQVFAAVGAPDLANDDDLIQDAARGRRIGYARELAGRFLLGRGLVEEAVGLYRQACALNPESVEVRLRLGDSLRRLGRDEEARKAYEQARALSPKDERTAERLQALALGSPVEGGRAPVLAKATDIEGWDRRIPREALASEPEAAYANALPPLIAEGSVVVLAPGTTTIFALDAKDGTIRWKASLARPAPPEGVAADRVGLEPAGLVLAPAAACMRVAPGRARERVPLIALMANEWVKAPGRTFKKASFEACLVAWIDPRDGKLVGTERLLDSPIAASAPPVAKGSRALVLTQPGEEKTLLVLLDLVAKRARWSQELAGGASRRPAFAGDLIVASYASGLALLDGEGAVKLSALEGSAPSAGAAESGGTLYVGAGRSVRAAPLAGGEARDAFTLPGTETASGSLAAIGTRLFVASRGGPLRAFATDGRVLATQTLQGSDRAASRELVAVSGKLFALNGSEDSYKDELPSLVAFDPDDLSILWRRPMDRPAALAASEHLAVACSGGAGSQGGLRIVGARPGGAAVDARPRFLREVRAAADDALADDEAEVAILIARRWIALKGGLSLVATDDLVFFARVLARSRRPDDAESVLAIVHARDTSADADKNLERLRKELKLSKDEPPPEEPKKQDEKK